MDWMRNLDGNQINIFVKKKEKLFFRRTNIYYIQNRYFFFQKKEKVFTLNSNTYYLIYNFF